MNELEPFNYGEFVVRVIMIDGEPWFMASDVCAVLGYVNGSRDVHRHVRPGQAQTYRNGTFGRDPLIVSEPGLYRMIMRSNQPDAEPFQDWVTGDVLPSIRRTGAYAVADQHAIPQSFAEALELAASQARAIEEQDRELTEARPKVEAFDQLIDGHGNFLMGTTAKMINAKGLGQNKLYELLRANGVLQSRRGSDTWNVPKQNHIDAGRFVVKARPFLLPDGTTGASHTTLVTPKGLEFIRRLVTGMGYEVPVMSATSPSQGV